MKLSQADQSGLICAKKGRGWSSEELRASGAHWFLFLLSWQVLRHTPSTLAHGGPRLEISFPYVNTKSSSPFYSNEIKYCIWKPKIKRGTVFKCKYSEPFGAVSRFEHSYQKQTFSFSSGNEWTLGLWGKHLEQTKGIANTNICY